MNTRNRMALIGLAVTLTACSGGGGASGFDLEIVPLPPPIPPANAGGVWEGSTFNHHAGLTFETVGVVTENGTEARFVNDEGQQFILFDFSGIAGSVSASVTALAPPGTVFIDGSTRASGTLTATRIERTSIDGSWSLSTGETGTITLSYNALYERGSDVARTVGSWIDSFGVVYSVDATGSIFAQDADGCVYDDAVSVISAPYNAYRVELTVSSCPGAEGVYRGLGVMADDLGVDDAFFMQLDNGETVITDVLLKL